jgi:hypothetical protein
MGWEGDHGGGVMFLVFLSRERGKEIKGGKGIMVL